MNESESLLSQARILDKHGCQIHVGDRIEYRKKVYNVRGFSERRINIYSIYAELYDADASPVHYAPTRNIIVIDISARERLSRKNGLA